MSMALNLLASMLFLLGCVLIAANWAVVAKNAENRRKGIERHSSTITLVPQVILLLSGICFHASLKPWLDWWIALGAGVPDPGIWSLVLLIFSVQRDRPRDLSPRCSICGRHAASIRLAEHSGTWILKYSGPGGSNGNGDSIQSDRAEAIRAAFSPPFDAANIRAVGFADDAGFCAECGTFYCDAHWNISSTGGGKCPRGHFKSLDPHWSPE